jgi:uncharacterized protein
MQYSKHNIFSKIAGSEDYFLVNPLSRQADILDPDEAKKYADGSPLNKAEFLQKGYLVDPDEEERRFRREYLNFIDERDQDEVQLFFTPWYSCNFACSYCFQDAYTQAHDQVDDEVIEAFFGYVDAHFAHRRTYITLFGGEPLLNAPAKKASIRKVFEEAAKRKLELAVVSNGYHVLDYMDLLKQARIREVQLTVDGTQPVHDSRRMLKGGAGSFDRIAKGVDALLENRIPVNLRMIVDKDNVQNLPDLARFAIGRGWTNSPLFKTALGRNYELHHCQTNQTRLFSRIEMYQDIYQLVLDFPEILEFHRPAFSIAKFIFENGEMPQPLFDSCSGAKTEWAFDYTGRIYSCTATVGHVGDELGTFYPEVKLNEDLVEDWEDRDVIAIEACRACPVQLACGGGCAAVAKNRSGKLHAPDCRPVKGLLELGIGLYSRIPVEE